MGKMQNIRSRMGSIESTRQITESMRLVSSSKVQTARRHMEEARPFFEQTISHVQDLIGFFSDTKHRYLGSRTVKAAGVIAIASDRGLCGGYNVNIVRETKALLKTLPDYKLITVGTQLWDRFRRQDIQVTESFHGVSETPYFEDALEVAEHMTRLYDEEEIDEIYLVHTQFISMLEQQTTVAKLLPIPRNKTIVREEIFCEPGVGKVLDSIVPLYLAAYLHRAMTESAVCEQSARITSMDAASRNSEEMIDKLKVEYNKARQGAITQELTEIVAGAGALE